MFGLAAVLAGLIDLALGVLLTLALVAGGKAREALVLVSLGFRSDFRGFLVGNRELTQSWAFAG
jgi:hypothetical protein